MWSQSRGQRGPFAPAQWSGQDIAVANLQPASAQRPKAAKLASHVTLILPNWTGVPWRSELGISAI